MVNGDPQMTQINTDNICMDSMSYLRTSVSSADKGDEETYAVIGAAIMMIRR